MDKEKPTEKEILEAVKKSGYLLEQEVATILEKNGFQVETNKPFRDLDKGKSREIDVFATMDLDKSEHYKKKVCINLLCECKNNSNPYVFIGRNKSEKDKEIYPLSEIYMGRMEGSIIRNSPLSGIENYLRLNYKPLFNESELKYVQFTKIIQNKGKERWKANHEGFFDEIIIPIIKAKHYYNIKMKYYSPNKKAIWLHRSVVILNSELYSIDSTKKELELETKKYLSFLREIDSEKIKGKFFIDFTNKKNFQEYLEKQIHYADKVRYFIDNKSDKYGDYNEDDLEQFLNLL